MHAEGRCAAFPSELCRAEARYYRAGTETNTLWQPTVHGVAAKPPEKAAASRYRQRKEDLPPLTFELAKQGGGQAMHGEVCRGRF